MGRRGQKICPSCGITTGPRKKVCECGHIYVFKSKSIRPVKTEEVDWTLLEKGQLIKIQQGSGPYWLNEDGEKICMGYYGKFKVHRIMENGIEAYPKGKNSENSGLCFIYMGPSVKSKYGTYLEKHKVLKLKEKPRPS